MRGLEEKFPEAKVCISHTKIKIALKRGRRPLKAYLDKLVIPYWVTVEIR